MGTRGLKPSREGVGTLRRMAVSDAVVSLPDLYCKALRALLDGEDETSLAAMLGVPVEALPVLLQVAAAKLHAAITSA